MTSRSLLLGRLRRDTMILASSEDESELVEMAKEAVATGRASEAFVVPVTFYASESNHAWDPEGTNATSDVSSVPPLNPGAGEQESLDDPAPKDGFQTIQGNIEKIGETSPKGPDTGSDPEGKPTGTARSQAELDAGKPAGKVPEPSSAKTASMDKK